MTDTILRTPYAIRRSQSLLVPLIFHQPGKHGRYRTNSRPLAGVFHHHYRGAPRAEEGRRLNAPQCTTSHRLITPPTIRARESSAIVGEHEQVYLLLAAVIGSTAQHPVLGGPLHRQLPALATRDHPSETQRQASGVRRQAPRRRTHCKRRDNNALPCVTKHRIALPLARTPEAPHYWERRLISCSCFASTLATSSDGPPALVAHSPVGGLLSRFRPGETQSRRGTHSSDSVHSANPEECGAGVTHPRTPPTRCAFR